MLKAGIHKTYNKEPNKMLAQTLLASYISSKHKSDPLFHAQVTKAKRYQLKQKKQWEMLWVEAGKVKNIVSKFKS